MINCTKSRGLMWIRVYDEASKTFPYSLHDNPIDAISGPREGEGELRVHWIYVNFYTSPIIPQFEIDVPGFEVTYLDDIVLPRQVGTVLLRGTPPTPSKKVKNYKSQSNQLSRLPVDIPMTRCRHFTIMKRCLCNDRHEVMEQAHHLAFV